MKAILTDVTKCIGCQQCVLACKDYNKLDKDMPRDWHRNDGLSARNWTSIIHKPDEHYIRKQCRHCIEPACVSACPVAALSKSPEGPVTYDPGRCIGCRYCMIACPYGIPRYEWDNPVPYIQKCNMCYSRIKEGKQPACTEACPTEATIFGDRDELLAEAHRRIKNDPDLYIGKVFGEFEIGGTQVLYISDIDLGFLSYPVRKDTPVLPETTAPAMSAVPPAFFGMGAVMGGLYWFCKRKERIKREKEENKE
ncbi:MAG: 4Fe-4S dicluster domain-containing protein [candidate division Zixibacteria bacterium]|nr:4Fe-4S dicluster domain-containing protein [candidate division Zixibacteria bacterium]